MKTAIICAICTKPKKFSDSYALKITKYIDSETATSTGTTLVTAKNGQVVLKARACRICIKKMGYKVKTIKKAKI